MCSLRKGGIYELPDGSSFIAMPAGLGNYFLYEQRQAFSAPPYYVIDTEGAIKTYPAGRTIEWRIDDLTDTGEVHISVRGSCG